MGGNIDHGPRIYPDVVGLVGLLRRLGCALEVGDACEGLGEISGAHQFFRPGQEGAMCATSEGAETRVREGPKEALLCSARDVHHSQRGFVQVRRVSGETVQEQERCGGCCWGGG
jgi:hypothetical protein